MQLCLLLLRFSAASTERATPAYWLNNWSPSNPLIAIWSAASDSWTIDPNYRPGIQRVRAFSDLTRDVFTDDSFALVVDSKDYTNPLQLNSTHLGGCVQEPSGELWTEYTHYGKEKMPVKVRKSYYLPPQETFYVIKYEVSSQDGQTHSVKLLDFLSSARDHQWSKGACENGICTIDTSAAYLPSIAYSSTATKFSVGFGDFTSADNPLKFFSQKHDITAFSKYDQETVAAASLFEFTVKSGETVTFYAARAVAGSAADAKKLLTSLDHKKWISETNTRYAAFLARGIQPSLSGDALDLYKKSILTLKNSQNPKLGTIASSLHPLYGFKNWMRDSLMAAFMLDSAGYHEECEAFFDWVPSAPLTDIGGFHTCYNTFTGGEAPFVEPQHDAIGLYLIAMNFHFSTFNKKDFIAKHKATIIQKADFLVNRKGKFGLSVSDRAPWEESTDHHTGEPIDEQFYPWTQGLSYGGLKAAEKMMKALGDTQRADQYGSRAEEIKQAVMTQLWDDDNSRFYRGRWANNFQPDTRAEAATLSVIFTGLVGSAKAKSHLNFIVKKLEKLNGGISRYENDPYFFDSIWNPCGKGTYETQKGEPVWPVTTAYAAWCEQSLGIDYQRRLDFMVKYSAWGNMPTGEAVDPVDGALVVPSSPDGFEHGGVYVYTTLLKQHLTKSILDTLN